MKRTFLQLIPILGVFLLLSSCNKTDNIARPKPHAIEQLKGTIGDQLRLSQQALASHSLPVKIVSYNEQSVIESEAQLSAVEKKLISESAMVPEFDGTTVSGFSVSTIAQRMATYQANRATAQNVVENIRQIAFPMLKTGQKVLDIVWEAGGKQFHSTCIYNEEGVVYDNMLSNISFVEKEEGHADEVNSPAVGDKVNAGAAGQKALAQYSFTSTVLNYTITWVWGGTRGKIIIKHYIIWNGVNYIIDHGGTSDAWMSAGSASGRWANNYLSRSSRSKMAWAYGWATPTASFNISFNSSNLTFSTGTSGVGSKGSGSGVHTIYI